MPKTSLLRIRLRPELLLLAALSLTPLTGWAAAVCRFDAHGQQVAPLPTPPGQTPPPTPWGGMGGTGVQTATAQPEPKNGWGGLGGTGIQQPATPGQRTVAKNLLPDHEGWGGLGGTGIQPQSAKPATSTADNQPAAHEGWGGLGGTGLQTAPIAAQPRLAGYILYRHGKVLAQQPGLPARELTRGDAVCEGDAIMTAENDGLLQIRMADQGSVMLYSGSKLHINTFNLPEKIDGSERLAMTLEQGGMRAMTGDIGHLNKQNYLIRTPSAEVHIRGTDHELFQVPAAVGRFSSVAPGTYDHVISGGTTLLNPAGSVRIEPTQSGFAPLDQGAPKTIEVLPEVLRNLPLRGLAPAKTSEGSSDNAAGSGVTTPTDPLSTALPNRIVSNSVVLDLSVEPQDSPANSAYVGVTVADGQIQRGHLQVDEDNSWQIGVDPRSGLPLYVVQNDGSLLFFVDDDTQQPVQYQIYTTTDGAKIYWGVYFGGGASDANGDWQYADLHQFAFAPGGATPGSAITAMSGQTGSYTMVPGMPGPVDENGKMGGQINSLTANVTFGANPTIDHYAINVTDGQGRIWDANSGAAVSLQTFQSSGIALNGSCTGCQSPTISNGSAAGVLIGPQAGGMISHYGLQTNQNESVSGVGILKKP
ncbi:hypothetical protein [Paludibacterium sp. THUN1379]|uniref:FecR family protein n=1 Tax=Paludibacterium sp. THUN1379 TaxID=3112107 RepID=UPI0030CBA959